MGGAFTLLRFVSEFISLVDIQEYTGSFTADQHGSLSFRDGLLVNALRCGHWVILDELNLAPSEVLEALNRLLDDNRELFLAEVNETVKRTKISDCLPHRIPVVPTAAGNHCHEPSAIVLLRYIWGISQVTK